MHSHGFRSIAKTHRSMWARSVALLVAAMLLTSPSSSFAQSYTFTRVIDTSTARPDGEGNFNPPHTVSTDGRYVVWGNSNSYLSSSIWSADLNNDLALTRLADLNTPVPGGTGNFTSFDQRAGGRYSGFNIIVRNATAVFLGQDSEGTGLYSVPGAGGAITPIVNYNTRLPNGGTISRHNAGAITAFGVNDLGTIVLSGLQDAPFGQSIFTAAIDGSKLTAVGDEDHRLQNPSFTPSCVDWNNASIAIGASSGTGDVVVFSGEGDGWQGFYTRSAMMGTSGPNCSSTPQGPIVSGSNVALPGDPHTPSAPIYNFAQTDGQNIYFLATDFSLQPCCNAESGNWGGIFSIPVKGGPVTRIVADGDVLPDIGQVTNLFQEFSVDNGGVVFLAINGVDDRGGIFLWSGGQITKVLATGDTFDGIMFPDASSLNISIWPQGYSNGVIAFGFDGAVFVASAD